MTHGALQTTTVGSHPIPAWLRHAPSEAAVLDATRAVFAVQREAGIDLPTDGELYRFDPDHPDTNGMIDWFVRRMDGTTTRLGRARAEAFRRNAGMRFRGRPAAAVTGPLGEGALDLLSDCARAACVAGGPFKFTVTSPYMLARTLLDEHYGDFERLTLALADVLAEQVRGLPAACLQVDEANVTGSPVDAPFAARAINTVLDAATGEKAVHLCFGNYGGQTVQQGTWAALLDFLAALHADHVVLELAHRPAEDLDALRGVDPRLALGIGVVDVKVNRVETPDEVATAIERAADRLGVERIRYVHPDCGLWMLPRSVAERKLHALVAGLDRYLGTP